MCPNIAEPALASYTYCTLRGSCYSAPAGRCVFERTRDVAQLTHEFMAFDAENTSYSGLLKDPFAAPKEPMAISSRFAIQHCSLACGYENSNLSIGGLRHGGESHFRIRLAQATACLSRPVPAVTYRASAVAKCFFWPVTAAHVAHALAGWPEARAACVGFADLWRVSQSIPSAKAIPQSSRTLVEDPRDMSFG